MKIEIQKIVRPIRLADYAPEYGDAAIHVWVNPPRGRRLAYFQVNEEFGRYVDERKALLDAVVEKAEASGVEDASERTLDELDPGAETVDALAAMDGRLEDLSRRLYGWFAEMWSQEGDEWTAEDVGELVEASMDRDPRFWSWIQDEHWRLVGEHRDGVKKK